ncbi:MAG: hypothetical protein K2X81_07960 [Candidatus Obscuribacterales bacterium]|mgnify:CR=1 FL=1|nr:hypothetical protein [Candidatus Obscuribacterales bacterium]
MIIDSHMHFLALMVGSLTLGIGQGMMLQTFFKREHLQQVSWFLARAYFGLMVLALLVGQPNYVGVLMLAMSAFFGGITLVTEPRQVAS